MKQQLSRSEYSLLRALLLEVRQHEKAQGRLEQVIRRLFGASRKDAQTANDYLFDMIYNDVAVEETLDLLGVKKP